MKTTQDGIDQARREGRLTERGIVVPERREPCMTSAALFDGGPPDVVVIDNLPFPPSVNDYLTNVIVPRVKGQGVGNSKTFRIQTFPSELAKSFREQCIFAVKAARPMRLKGFLRCEVVFFPPNHIRRDLDNQPKCLLDGLKHAGLFDDDSQIHELSAKWAKSSDGSVLLCKPHGKTAIRLTTLGV